jgi:biotin carboxyl carrier protein
MDETMTAEPSAPLLGSLRQLQKLRNLEGEPAQFWNLLLQTLAGLCGADAGIVCLRTPDAREPWTTLAAGPEGAQRRVLLARLSEALGEAVDSCAQKGHAHIAMGDCSIIAVNLLVDADPRKCIALFHVRPTGHGEAMALINLLLANNDIPVQFRMQQSAFEAVKNQGRWSDLLDIMVMLNSQRRFVAAAMTVCNELAGRYGCDRVSLGWLKNGMVRVKAMSHTDNFEKKMEAVQQLELAMEEAVDQDADIIVPAQESAGLITRDHLAYAKGQDVEAMTTLIVRKKDEPVAVFSFERGKTPLTETDLRLLRITVDLVSTRLTELKSRDCWFGARLAHWMREGLGGLVGYEHTWAKFFGLLGAAALIAVTCIPVRYRVDSPMILRTDDVSYITAPFDGYIESVAVKAGDAADTGQTLLSLDKKDLILEEAGLLAEKNRQQREVEKARASGELADMCIAQARLDQAAARLDVTRYKLERAAIVSPFNGVIIEGDQLERIGSPVKQGEVLFKVGRIKNMYAEAKVSENEIQNIAAGSGGQIALASRPQEPFDIGVWLVEPSAVVSQKDNVFLVRCAFNRPVPGYFRPGMTGISKINAGRKTLLWIVGHRTVDFLRLKLWW